MKGFERILKGEESVIKKRIYAKWCCYFFILFGFCITRFWRLTTLPAGIHIDEAGTAYNGWCIANYGVDRFLKSWPIYFKNFDGGQSALYTYLCAVCIRLFGFSVWSIRLPAVFSSFLTLIFGMKMTEKVFPSNACIPYVAGGLIVICPYFIMASRFGLDCNLALGFSTLFLYLFICAVENGRTLYYILAGIAGGILLYTYALTYIFVPIFLFFSFFYLLWTKKLNFRNWLIMAIPFGILAFPLILVQIIHILDLEETRLWIFTLTKMERYRASEIGGFQWEHFVQALTSIFTSDSLAYNTVPGGYALYGISIALFVLGVCSAVAKLLISLQRRQYHALCFPVFWIISILYFESHIDTNANKLNAVFFMVVLMIVEGMRVLCSVRGRLHYILPGLLGAVYLLCFLHFGSYYYGGKYTAETYPLIYFDTMVTEAVRYIEADEELRQRKTYMAENSLHYLISVLPSPYEIEISDDVSNYGNYYFHQLGEIEGDCNYIVRDIYTEYKDELHEAGFQEIEYPGYSLFYKKQNSIR